MFQIWAHYLDFEDAKNIHVLQVLIWGFRGHWRFPTEAWHLDLDLNMVNVFGTTIFQILSLYLDFESAKKIHVL